MADFGDLDWADVGLCLSKITEMIPNLNPYKGKEFTGSDMRFSKLIFGG